MEDKILIFGHKNPDTDSICSSIVKQILNEKDGKTNTEAVRLGNVNKETAYVLEYLKIEAPKLIEGVEEGQKVILVDHNEFSQSADGIENAKIIGVVDHHRIANFQTSDPLYYTARPYGCTATILFKDFEAKNIEIERKEAILMASAIISDTLLLKSPTTTKYDEEALEKLAEIAKIDVNKYGIDMLKAGTDLDDFSAEQLVNLDAKSLEKNGNKFVIAQVNTVDISDILTRKEEIKNAIENEIEKNNLELFVFVITDILNSNSQILSYGNSAKKVEEAFEKELEDNMMFLEGVVSRKKQLLPKIDGCF